MALLQTLHRLFDNVLPPLREDSRAAGLRLVTAVLLVEVMRAHRDLAERERATVLGALQREFALGDADARALLAEAEATSERATDYQSYTLILNERLDESQKLRVIEAMWRVAYADGELDAYENHVLWRISDLLYLPHGAYIAAKMRARDASVSAPTTEPADGGPLPDLAPPAGPA